MDMDNEIKAALKEQERVVSKAIVEIINILDREKASPLSVLAIGTSLVVSAAIQGRLTTEQACAGIKRAMQMAAQIMDGGAA